MRRLTIALLGLTMAAAMTGCFNENQGWPWAESHDAHVFKSTALSPKTVVITDLVTREEVYRIDIPVEHTCKIKFVTDENRSHSLETVPRQHEMRYRFQKIGAPVADAEKTVPLANAVRMDVIIRDTAEIPEPVPTEPDIAAPAASDTPPAPVQPEPVAEPAPQPQPDADPASDLEKSLGYPPHDR